MKIAQKSIKFLTVAMLALYTATAFATVTDKKNDNQNDGGRINTKEEVEAFILHHIKAVSYTHMMLPTIYSY